MNDHVVAELKIFLCVHRGYINANDPQTWEQFRTSISFIVKEGESIPHLFLPFAPQKENMFLVEDRSMKRSKLSPWLIDGFKVKSNNISRLDDDCARTGPTGFFQDEEFAKWAEYRTNLMRATLLLFFLYACRLGRSSIRSRWSKRSPL